MRREILPLLALLAGAAVVRFPLLNDIPPYTDETREVLLGFALALGAPGRLTNVDPYIGSGFNYLLAGLFKLVGPSMELPRLGMLVLGVLTVGLTYGLARQRHHPLVALLAAGLLATCLSHVVMISHVAWSSCAVPFATTLASLALQRSLSTGKDRWLPLAGLAFGVAVQAHAISAALVPAAAVGLGLAPRGRRLLWSRWGAGAGALALLGCANLLVYNLVDPGAGLRRAEQLGYVFRYVDSPEEYLARLSAELQLLGRVLASVVPAIATPWATGAPLVEAGLLAALAVGFVRAVRRRDDVLPWLLALPLLIMPLVLRRYQDLPGDSVRYAAPLWPLAYVLIADALVAGGHALQRRCCALPALARLGVVGASALLGLLLLLRPLPLLAAYYGDFSARGASNAGVMAATQALLRETLPDEPIVIDQSLDRMWLDTGGGRALQSLLFTLTMRGRQARAQPIAGQPAAALVCGGDLRDRVVVLSKEGREALRTAWELLPIRAAPDADERWPLWAGTKTVWIDRVEPPALRPPAGARFGGMELAGWNLHQRRRSVRIVLEWKRTADGTLPSQRTLRVVDAAGNLLAQQTAAPGGDRCPTDRWRVGEPVLEGIVLPTAKQAAGARLYVSWLDPRTDAPLLLDNGEPELVLDPEASGDPLGAGAAPGGAG